MQTYVFEVNNVLPKERPHIITGNIAPIFGEDVSTALCICICLCSREIKREADKQQYENRIPACVLSQLVQSSVRKLQLFCLFDSVFRL